MSESQRGLVAAKLANMPHGGDRGNQHKSAKPPIDGLAQEDAAKHKRNRAKVSGTKNVPDNVIPWPKDVKKPKADSRPMGDKLEGDRRARSGESGRRKALSEPQTFKILNMKSRSEFARIVFIFLPVPLKIFLAA